MKRNTERWRRLAGWLCVSLAIVCAFCLFCSHFHRCEGTHCALCGLLEVLSWVLLPGAVALGRLCIDNILLFAPGTAACCAPQTLVGLKVKLSD